MPKENKAPTNFGNPNNLGVVEQNLNIDKPDFEQTEEKKDFFKKLNDKKKKVEAPNTYASGNLTGITGANQRSTSIPGSHYKDLHEDVGIDLFSTPENWEKLGYSEQSAIDVALNSTFGFFVNVAAGVLEGVGGNDPSGLYNISMGNTEERYGNIFNEWAADLLQYTSDELHIYDAGENSPFSFTYWGKQMQNLGYSVGIIGEMFAEAAILKKASGSSLKLLSKGTSYLSNPAVFGSYQGIKEAYLNGLQTGEQTYLKYKDIGYSEKDAKQKGNEAATLGFRMEVLPLMAMNALQFASVSKYNPFMERKSNLGFSGGFETLSDYAFKNINNKYLKKIADYGTNMTAEAIEEGIQTGIGKKAQYEIGYADGLVNKKSIDDILFDDDEMRDSMIGGALGGGVFRFMGKRFNKLTKGTEIKKQQAEYDNYLTGIAKRVNLDTAELQQAINDNDQEKADIIRKRMQRNNVLEALQYDLMNQDEKAFDTYISSLKDMQEAMVNGDVDKMKQYGITEPQDVEMLSNNISIYIEDANNIKQKLVDTLQNTDDVSAAIQITDSSKTLEELREFEGRSQTVIDEHKKNNKSYQSLTEVGKQQYDLMTERAALIAKATHGSVTEDQKNRIEEINSELETIKEENKKYKGRANDNRTLKTIDGTPVIKEIVNQLEMQEYQKIVSDKLNYWQNKSNQRKERIKRAKKKISKANKAETLKKAKEDLKAEESLSPEVEENINAKIEKAEVKDIANNGKVDTPFGQVVQPNKQEKKLSQENKVEPTDIKTPFGTVVKDDISIEDLKVNPEREAKADDIVKDLGIEKSGDSITINNDDLFEPAVLGSFTEAQLDKLKNHIADYYASLKEELGREPNFEEFIRDFIKNNTKEAADRIFNALVEGWKANNFTPTDYDEVYNKVFRDRKEMSSDILNVADEMIEVEGKPKVEQKNKEIIEKAVDKKAPTVVLDSNNRPSIKDTNSYRTSSPELKAAHLSIPYEREIVDVEDGGKMIVDTDTSENLNSASDINSKKLLNPNKFNEGTKLTVKIADNYKEIKVSTWIDDFTQGPSMTFGQWENLLSEQLGEGSDQSQAWLEKVPMVAIDEDGEAVFFIHSTDWYNAINVGFKDDITKQAEVIEEARTNLITIREKVIANQSLEIEITNKRPGTLKTINKDQPALTLEQANPHTQLGVANDQGELIVNGEYFEKEGKTLINEELFQRGHTYDIRQTGKGEYIALKVLREKISEEAITSIQKVTEVYTMQFDELGVASDQIKNKQIRDNVLNITGIDIYTREGFEEYLNLFMPTVSGKFSGIQDIANAVEANSKIAHGTSYASIQKGALVFGVKGQEFSKGNKVLYVHPRKIGDKGGVALMKGVLTDFNKILPKVTQNVSRQGLNKNKTLAFINSEGTVTPSDNYETFLKKSLKTNVKSFNIGTKEKPVYATIIQPVINFKVAKEKTKFEKINEVATKVVESQVLTKEETTIVQEDAQEVQATTKERYEAKKVDKVQTLKDTLISLREMGVQEDDSSLQFVIEQLKELGEEDTDYAPIAISDELIVEMKEDTTGTNGLTILQDFQIVDYIFNEVTTKLDFKHKSAIGKNELLKGIKNSYMELIEPKKIRTESTIENLKKLNAVNPNERMTALISKMEGEITIFNTIKQNWKSIENKALDKVFKYTGIQESRMNVKEVTDASTEQEKNYSKSSLEENGKATASYRLKRFFSGIKQVDASGKTKDGFLGVQTYVGFDTVYSTIEQIISSPYEVDSKFEEMVLRLEENIKVFPWLQQVVDELRGADEQIQNEFVYNFARHTLSMKFVMFSKNRDNTYTLKVYDTNATEITRVIRQQWDSNFKQSPLTYVEDGLYKISKVKAKSLLTKFNEWEAAFKANPGTRKQDSTVNIPTIEIQSWLSDFGISLSTETIEEMKKKPMIVMSKEGSIKLKFSQMFNKSATTSGIFGLLADYLENISERQDTTFEENPDNHPFNNATNVLKELAKKESKYSTFATTNSFRDGDKSIYGFTPTKHTTDVAKQLKYDQEFRNQLLNKSFNKHAYMLNLLNTDESFAEKFYIDHLGITSLKELGKKVFGDNSITALSDSDHELTKLGLFQDLEQGEVNGSLGEEGFVNFRMARMFMPTMSDKSQMLMMNTAVLNLMNKHFNIDSNNNVTMQDELVRILYKQLVKPELERLHNFASTIKKTNIKNYDTAAQMFLMIPEMNNLMDKKTGKRAISLMANAPELYNPEWFEATFVKEIKAVIKNMVTTEVNNKLAEWEEAGFFTEEEGTVTETKFLNQKYLEKFQGAQLTKLKLSANDFVINNLISNANTLMMIAGDIAMYSQGKINKYFQDGKAYLPKEKLGNNAYAKAVKEVISVNVGKRLALMLTPGNKLANSKGAKYTQIFMNDHIDVSSNILALVNLFYERVDVDYVDLRIKEYNKAKDSQTRQSIAKELSSRFPEISDYFEIEATDAQEYTTASEHINVLYSQGRLSNEQYTTIMDKIKVQLKAEKEDKSIPESALLNYNELSIVLNPIKPVHTGFKNEDRYDAMRMVYIKSSSFPLLPQITKGTELDKLRKMLENLEEVKGTNVRASYQTANKVGAVTTAITPFNPDGTFNENITTDKLLEASLTLDRDNFRIQQDVPFKSDKRKEDVVSLGTQTLKLLFGDGMLDFDGFEFEGETLTGRELQQKFNKNFEEYIQQKKKTLYDQLGVDEFGQPKDIGKTMNMLQELLKREATERGYPKQDIEALKLTPTLDNEGNVVDVQFSTPLWLSPNSNRYESLLNAIVTNKLVNLKIPGNSFVVGSEAGFKMQSDLSGINQSRIIYSPAYDGEIKAAEFNKDGSLKRAQIMIPSKFRDNSGNLIQFIDEKGKPNPAFVERDEKGILRFKEGAIDSELLNITSFRIPTSAHISMSQLEIVGILPTEVGDLMIVPRNLTKQKGLDFDVDKEVIYQLHTYVDPETGLLRPITEEDTQTILKIADNKNTKDWNDDSAESKLLRAIFGEDPDFILEDIDEGSKLERVKNRLEQKLLENKFVRVHSAVLNNPNKEVQKKINKVLSMDFAKSQAELVQQVTEENEDNTYFSMLSDSFQKSKMFLGASGKLGIGVYSNYVVFHSMSQQVSQPLQLMGVDTEGKVIPQSFTIGKYTSDGILGRQTSLATGYLTRNIAEAFAERQNTATDNEKEQIMGRLNINEITINADSLMTALGFDKDTLTDGTEVSIPYLLLSQPIIKDYVREIRKTRSNTAEYDAAAEMKVLDKIKARYGSEGLDLSIDLVNPMMTGQTLYDNLKNPEDTIQLAALQMFTKLDTYARTVSSVQNRLNITNEGLGKSFFDVLDKHTAIQWLPIDQIANVNSLVGEYTPREDIGANVEQALINDGAIPVGKYLIKPTNPVGSMLVHSIDAGYNLWKDYFPYDDPHLNATMTQILSEITSESTSSQKKVQLKQDVFKEFKKYLVSSDKLGVFDGNPQVRRKELFIDTKENKSLANYLNSILRGEGTSIDFLKSNKLVSRFQYDINVNGLPSTIRFDNTKGENFDEDYLYMALIELMEENRTLPDKNGEAYTTRQLAQDLIAYNYLEGGVQEAIQFSKYIPISYLNAVEFGSAARRWNNNHAKGIFKDILGYDPQLDTSRFTKQYLQHNPQRLPKVDPNKNIISPKYAGKSKNLSSLISFSINEDSLNAGQAIQFSESKFVAIYNPKAKKGLKKFQIYENIDGTYKRMSTLGVFGMSEYSIKDNDVTSLVNDTYRSLASSKSIHVTKSSNTDVFGVKSSTVQEVVENIANYDFKQYPQLKFIAQAIKSYINADLTISVADLVNSKGDRIAKGRHKDSKITIDTFYFSSASNEELAKTILHEIIHGLTTNYVDQFVDKEGNYKVASPPKEIVTLVRLFNETKRKLGPEIEAYKAKREKQLKGETRESSTEREVTVAYGGTNIREFITLVMTEQNFQEEMRNVQFKETDMSLWNKFASIINDILFKVFGPDYITNGVTAKGIETTLNLIEKQAEIKAKTKREAMEANDRLAEDLLNSPFGDVIIPSDEELGEMGENLESPEDSPTFVNPFKCK